MLAAPVLAYQGPAFEALNRLHQGILLLDASGRILFANRAAEEILAADAGLRCTNGLLHADSPEDTKRMGVLINGSGNPGRIDSPVCPIPFLRTHERLSLVGFLVPLTPCFGPEGASAILFVTDPEREHWPSSDCLETLFGLTPAEAAVTVAILRGSGLAEAAKRLSISITTARTHLNHVFCKTATRRQAELVRLIVQSCGPIRQS